MEVRLSPDLQAKVERWAAETGRPTDELVTDAMTGYFAELARVRGMLDGRYDELQSGQVKEIDGEAFFRSLSSKIGLRMQS